MKAFFSINIKAILYSASLAAAWACSSNPPQNPLGQQAGNLSAGATCVADASLHTSWQQNGNSPAAWPQTKILEFSNCCKNATFANTGTNIQLCAGVAKHVASQSSGVQNKAAETSKPAPYNPFADISI